MGDVNIICNMILEGRSQDEIANELGLTNEEYCDIMGNIKRKYTINTVKVRNNLKELRKISSLTINDVFDETGINVYVIENGKQNKIKRNVYVTLVNMYKAKIIQNYNCAKEIFATIYKKKKQ